MNFRKLASSLVLGGTLISITQNCLNTAAYDKKFDPKKVWNAVSRQSSNMLSDQNPENNKFFLQYLIDFILKFFKSIKEFFSNEKSGSTLTESEITGKINKLKETVNNTLALTQMPKNSEPLQNELVEVLDRVRRTMITQNIQISDRTKLKENLNKFFDCVIKGLNDLKIDKKRKEQISILRLSEKMILEFVRYNLHGVNVDKNALKALRTCSEAIEYNILTHPDQKSLSEEEKRLRDNVKIAKNSLREELSDIFVGGNIVDEGRILELLKDFANNTELALIKSEQDYEKFISNFLKKSKKEYEKQSSVKVNVVDIARFIADEFSKNVLFTQTEEVDENEIKEINEDKNVAGNENNNLIENNNNDEQHIMTAEEIIQFYNNMNSTNGVQHY